MESLVTRCAEIITAIKEDPFYKAEKCAPERFAKLREEQPIFHVTEPTPGTGYLITDEYPGKDENQLRLHLKQLTQAQQDFELRKQYYLKLEQQEKHYIKLLEKKTKTDPDNVLNMVFRQSFQAIQGEKDKLASGKPFRDNSENISRLLTCLSNYLKRFQEVSRQMPGLDTLIQPIDVDDIATESGLYKIVRRQAQTLIEKFRAGHFLGGGIEKFSDSFAQRIRELKEEIAQKEKIASAAIGILNEKATQYQDYAHSIEPKLLKEYRKASDKAVLWAGQKKIYSAVRAFHSAGVLGEIIDRQLQTRFYIETKLKTIAAKDKNNRFKAVLDTASTLIKNNKLAEADKLLNEVSSKLNSNETNRLKDLKKYIKLYERLRNLYLKHRLHLPNSPLSENIRQLREGIKKGDMATVKNAEYGITEKMTTLRIDNLEKIDKVREETITFSGTTVPFSAVVIKTGVQRKRIIADKLGRFSFKPFTLKEGENIFNCYNDYIYLFSKEALTFSITREVIIPYRDWHDLLTGLPLKDCPPSDILRCKNEKCLYYFFGDTLKEYLETQNTGCPNCKKNDFYNHKDKGFWRE